MFVNKYQINLSTLSSATTATTINIPINMEYQLVDQSEIIQRVFVDTETEKAINPIVDYEKTRFIPIDLNKNIVDKISYTVNLSGHTTYGAIGFNDDDIRYETEKFKQTYLNLSFYDSDNPLIQNLLSFITLYPSLLPSDLYQSSSSTPANLSVGHPKPANQINLIFTVENPITNARGKTQGYYMYDFKDELTLTGPPKYLYMRATFKNAKNGKSVNLMVNSTALPIDQLVNKLYTRYILVKDTNGYFYTIDNTYSNNVTYATNNVTVALYQILAT